MNLEERLRRLEFVHRTAGLTSWVWDIAADDVQWERGIRVAIDDFGTGYSSLA